MRNFWAIFKTQLLSYFGINKMLNGGKKGKLRLGLLIAIVCGVGLFMGGCAYLYSYLFASIMPIEDIVSNFNSLSVVV